MGSGEATPPTAKIDPTTTTFAGTPPNAVLVDTDGDGISDLCDNCFELPNPDQNDCDDDGVGDARGSEPGALPRVSGAC
mgnify:CR=1 FL=1